MPIKMTSVKNSPAARRGRHPGLRTVTGTLSAIALAGAVLVSTGTAASADGPSPAGTTSAGAPTTLFDLGLGLLHHLPHPLCWLCME